MDRINMSRRGNGTSIRTLLASSLNSDETVFVSRPVSGYELDAVVIYDRHGLILGGMPNEGKTQVIILDFNKIEGGLEQILTAEDAVALITGLVNKGIKNGKVVINGFDSAAFNAELTSQINGICENNKTKLETIVTAIRDVRVSRTFGRWKDLASVNVNRFIASTMGWVHGTKWVESNMPFAKTSLGKPKYALACYAYDAEMLTQTGQPLSVAIPTAQPTAIGVLGFYPNAQGGYDARYVGSMPAKPMVSDELTAAPDFIRHDAGAIATRNLINVIKFGTGNANQLFQNPDSAGHFTFTVELLTMSRRNPTAFVDTLTLVVAHTNGHKDVVKEYRAASVAYSAAKAKKQEIAAKDYGTTRGSKISYAGAIGTNRSTPRVMERELVGANVGADSLDDAFSFQG